MILTEQTINKQDWNRRNCPSHRVWNKCASQVIAGYLRNIFHMNSIDFLFNFENFGGGRARKIQRTSKVEQKFFLQSRVSEICQDTTYEYLWIDLGKWFQPT